MQDIRIIFSQGVFDVCFSRESLRVALGCRGAVASSRGATFLVTDHRVNALHGSAAVELLKTVGIAAVPYSIDPGETSKSVPELQRLYAAMATAGLGRDGLVIAFGGGVVSDLAGFAAATWMRGVDWLAIPTTMEAMVDACVGGKTAINLPAGKNLVGAFHHPKLVYVDPMYLRTLPPRDLRAGLAESIKHALLFDQAFLIQHERKAEAILRLEVTTILELIVTNIRLKGDVVRRDPMERSGERMLLNFGHTIGHALEAACGFALRHGECVALGMLAECRLAEQRGMLDAAVVQRVRSLLQILELPTRVQSTVDQEAVVGFLRRDKKSQNGVVPFVLLRGVGRPEIVDDVTEREIRQAIESILDHS